MNISAAHEGIVEVPQKNGFQRVKAAVSLRTIKIAAGIIGCCAGSMVVRYTWIVHRGRKLYNKHYFAEAVNGYSSLYHYGVHWKDIILYGEDCMIIKEEMSGQGQRYTVTVPGDERRKYRVLQALYKDASSATRYSKEKFTVAFIGAGQGALPVHLQFTFPP